MSRKSEIQNLINKYQRRLQKLKEKEAVLGISTPPEILTEIEDIELEVQCLNEELRELEQTTPFNIKKKKSRSSKIQDTWLIIKGVYSYQLENIAVRVIANVNGNKYVYPSSTKAQWLEVGPDMSPQRYRLPPARNGYNVQFSMVTLHENKEFEMISQWVEPVIELPFEGRYNLHVFHPASQTRSMTISASIIYEITNEIR